MGVGSNMEDAQLTRPNCEPDSCSEADFRALLHEQLEFTPMEIERAVRAYSAELPRHVGGGGWNQWYTAENHLGADQMMTCASRRLARWVTKSGQRAYWYYFSYPPKLNNGTSTSSCHGCDLPYLFHNPTDIGMQVDSNGTLSSRFVKYWSSFAKSGVPESTMT